VYDTVRLLEQAASSTRVVWLVLATIRDERNTVPVSLAMLRELTGLPPARVDSGLRNLALLGLLDDQTSPTGPVWHLTTLFTVMRTTPELPLALPPLPPAEPVVSPDTLMAAWNMGATHLHPCRVLTPTRRERAWARLRHHPD